MQSFSDAKQTDIALFQKFFHGMLNQGIYLAPSAFEAGFISVCHTDETIETTIEAARNVFASFR